MVREEGREPGSGRGGRGGSCGGGGGELEGTLQYDVAAGEHVFSGGADENIGREAAVGAVGAQARDGADDRDAHPDAAVGEREEEDDARGGAGTLPPVGAPTSVTGRRCPSPARKSVAPEALAGPQSAITRPLKVGSRGVNGGGSSRLSSKVPSASAAKASSGSVRSVRSQVSSLSRGRRSGRCGRSRGWGV